MTLPVRVVLVETHGLQNLCAVARLLDNFEVQDWVLVSPKCSPSDPEALAYATGISARRLESVRVVPDLASALREVRVSVAFSEKSAFRKEPTRACLQDLEGWIRSRSHSENATEGAPEIALVFGNERNGLSAEDIEGCTHVVRLSVSSSLESMNLSHAVAIVLSRLFEAGGRASGPGIGAPFSSNDALQAAPHGEREAFYEHLREFLQALELDRGGGPDRLLATLRRALERALLRSNEVKAFRSICSRGIQKLTS